MEKLPVTIYTLSCEILNSNPELSPSRVEYQVVDENGINVDNLLDHFSRFLVSCGFASYKFKIDDMN